MVAVRSCLLRPGPVVDLSIVIVVRVLVVRLVSAVPPPSFARGPGSVPVVERGDGGIQRVLLQVEQVPGLALLGRSRLLPRVLVCPLTGQGFCPLGVVSVSRGVDFRWFAVLFFLLVYLLYISEQVFGSRIGCVYAICYSKNRVVAPTSLRGFL